MMKIVSKSLFTVKYLMFKVAIKKPCCLILKTIMNKYIDMSRAFVALGESAPPTRGSTNQIPGKAMKQRV